MICFRSLLLIGVFFSSLYLSAFDEVTLKTKTLLLVNTIRANHVAPRTIDAAFAQDVHSYLMQSLDPRNFVFSAEDEHQLSELAAKIPDDINNGTFVYLREAERLFNQRIHTLSDWNTEFSSKPLNFTSTARLQQYWLDHKVPAAEHKKLFESYLQLSVYSSIFAAKGNYDRPLKADSLELLGEKFRKSVTAGYSELFKEIGSDEQFFGNAWLDAIALAYDPHSHYFSPAEKQEFVAELQSEREIFGLSWDSDGEGNLVVIGVVPGSSAWMSGQVHEGDKLRKVRFGKGQWIDLTTGEMSSNKLRSLFNENTEKDLDFVIESDGKTQTVHLQKSAVYSDADILKNAVIPSEQKYGYIYLPDFYTDWTDETQLGCANDLAKCILKLQKENIDGIILDLRGNGGGSLKEAIDIVGIFIDYGPVLGTYDHEKKVSMLRDFNRGSIWNGPLMVLVDEGSASASEIVAGAVQDYHLGPIVGRPSFGKATSQQVMPLDNTGLTDASEFGFANVTEGILYRIDQSSNQRRGVIPDVNLPYLIGSAEELERNYPNALIAPAIDKKFTYTPKTQSFSGLQSVVDARRAGDNEFNRQMELIRQLNALEMADTVTSLNWSQFEQAEMAYRKKTNAMETQLEEMPASFTPSTNQFDKELFNTDPVLKKYNDSFLARTGNDIELREAVKVFNDWFRSNQ